MESLQLNICCNEKEMLGWGSQVCQYETIGTPGITYFKGILPGMVAHVDCLLFRDSEGKLRGILNHFPQNMPLERAGNFCIMVDPQYYRQGIAMKLVAEGNRRYHFNWNQQTYTPAGAALVHAFVCSKRLTFK